MTSAHRASWGTVRVRVTIAATLVVTFALVVSSWFVVRAVRSSLREDLRTESALALADALERFENRGPSNPLPVPSPSGFVIVAVERDGRIRDGSPGLSARTWAEFVGRTSRDPSIVGPDGRPFPNAIEHEQHIWFVAGRIFNFVPIAINDQPGFLVAAGTQATIESSVKTVTSAMSWTVPGLVVFMGLVAWGVTGRALRPVEQIRRDVAEITASSIDQRVYEPRNRDEVGRLARTMNQMLDRLHDASTRQRQFVSDASHELRSPVAAIRATGEVALSHPDTAEWPAVVERILNEDARMERIVGDLLDLARTDEGGIPTAMVDLDDIVFDEATQLRRPSIEVH
ncbi:MAG: HAMP domain-containing protein, partial [Acidimicrobiia bacterium]|nr:HAMP domain-containing protein [Acidimicrobiia bacterium]